MSVIATFSVPAGYFTFGQTISGNPGTRIRLDRVIPIGDTFIPYFWASDDSVEAVEADLRGESDISSFKVIDSTNGEAGVIVAAENAVQVLAALEGLGASVDTAQEAHARADYEEE